MLLIKGFVILSSILTTIIRCDSDFTEIDCSSPKLVYPCGCVNDNTRRGKIGSINCKNVFKDTIDLKLISQNLEDTILSGQSEPGEYVIEKLVIESSIIRQIKSRVFSRISFNEIEIIENKVLEFIDKNSFDGSINTLKSIKIVNNSLLYKTDGHEHEIWKFLSKFVNLQQLLLNGNNLRAIPSRAFHSEDRDFQHLRLVELKNNNIHTIGDYPFESLTAPSLRLWLNGNKISTIGKNVFKFKKSSKHVIRLIDLSNNLLTADSFETEAFKEMGRPLATLILNNNKIQTLPQPVFEPLFDRSEVNYFQLEVASNPFDCDCPLHWLLTTKYCYDEHKSAPLIDSIIELKCAANKVPISLVDFSNCNTREQLSPSCLKGQNSSVFSPNINKYNECLIVINALLMFQIIY